MGLIFNDPLLKIDWKIEEKSIIINEKDSGYSPFDSKIYF
jgi:dTDP-4-dehydrorhamnose 3,5-epimerase-like enzyme